MLGSAFLSAAVTAGAKTLTEKLVGTITSRVGNTIGARRIQLADAISEHMESTYEKCIYIKTILRDNREDFSKIYTSQGFLLPDRRRVNQDELVKYIRKGNTIVLQGTGGGGKSMFARYLWLYYFANFKDQIPVFIELRNLNNLTGTKLESYIYHTAVSKVSAFPEDSFLQYLKDGQIVLFLDGFDEINHSVRVDFQFAIIKLKEKFPRATIVVTSREDDRFLGWHQFQTVKVASLTKDECIDLLSQAPLDEIEKAKLIKRIKEKLFETHSSFLSNPLLAYMTLVTYSYNPNFSDRMFEFYELAFDALYYRHDLTKGGYTRKFYTNLNKNQFQKLLSYFCLRTYFDEQFEFGVSKLVEYVDDAKSIEASEFSGIDNEMFVRDIMESVCILKKDGVEFTFTHRKFQEYFAAYCITRVASRKIQNLFNKFSQRYSDDVLSMVYDFNSNLFREKYIGPGHEKFRRFFQLKRSEAVISNFIKDTGLCISLDFTPASHKDGKVRNRPLFGIMGSGELFNFRRSLSKIQKYSEFSMMNDSLSITYDEDVLMNLPTKDMAGVSFHRLLYGADIPTIEIIRKSGGPTIEFIQPISSAEWNNMFLKSYIENYALCLHRFVNDEMKNLSTVTERFESFFS